MLVRHPLWISRATAPRAESFALLFALESFARALMTAVLPLQALRLLGEAQQVSLLFFGASLFSLAATFLVPWLVRRTARRWVYSLGGLGLMAAPLLVMSGEVGGLFAGMVARVVATVCLTICLSLYIMDHISRRDMGRSEPMRLFYSAGAWTLGPVLGVVLEHYVAPQAPYLLSSAIAALLLVTFWLLRMTEPQLLLAKRRLPTPGPLGSLLRFFAQPRLAMAWTIAVARNTWWVLFVIYTPILAVQSGLGELVGGLLVSIGMGFLFLMPLWGWVCRRFGLRRLIVGGFAAAGLATLAVVPLLDWPWLAAIALLVGALALDSLDAAGNQPFMLAVHKGERAEMTAVYSTYRDIADIAPTGCFALLLKVFPLAAIYLAGGLAMLAMAQLGRRLHPRLGLSEPARRPAGAASRLSGATARATLR